MGTIRELPNGRYQSIIRLKGWPNEYKSHRTKTDAKRYIQRRESEIRGGTAQRKAKRLTLSELVGRYAELKIGDSRSDKTKASQLAWWKSQIGDRWAEDLSPTEIRTALDTLSVSPTTKNRYLAALSHVFTISSRMELVTSNPVKGVPRDYKAERQAKRTRFLSANERSRILEAAMDSAHPLTHPKVLLALYTGGRHGEIDRLNLDECFQRDRMAYVVFVETKNGESRSVPVPREAADVLEELRPHGPQPFTKFGQQTKKWRAEWAWVKQKADLEPDLRFHDLRHTYASWLAMERGASLLDIAKLMGHKTLQVTERYAHLCTDHLASLVGA